MTTTSKTPHQLRKGDVVRAHGGRFLVTANPRESSSHRPEGYWPQAGVGPSDCVAASSVCIQGEVPGYFKPGTEWSLQGNHRATMQVEVDPDKLVDQPWTMPGRAA